jgi:hypothetical protein
MRHMHINGPIRWFMDRKKIKFNNHTVVEVLIVVRLGFLFIIKLYIQPGLGTILKLVMSKKKFKKSIKLKK